MTTKKLMRGIILLVFVIVSNICASVHAETMSDLADRQKQITEIDIVNNPDVPMWIWQPKAMQIKDKKMIEDILSMITAGVLINDSSKVPHLSGMAEKIQLLLIAQDRSQQVVMLVYDAAFPVGYIEMDGQKYEVNYIFFRYMRNLNEYKKTDTKIDEKVIDIFRQYNWNVDYKVSESKVALPFNLRYEAGEFPTKIYWAYNWELSKNIGLDFSRCLGKTVDVEIYELREPLPDYMMPYQNARGIVLKYDGKIVGAYIDAGRHIGFACSLNKKSLREITGKSWKGWIDEYVNHAAALEIMLRNGKPEDIIKQYYEAMDKHDEKRQLACMTLKRVSTYLSMNMDNNKLYNSPGDLGDMQNVLSAKLLSSRELKLPSSDGTVLYEVVVDMTFKEERIIRNGKHVWFVSLQQEIPQTGWRITEIGTGP